MLNKNYSIFTQFNFSPKFSLSDGFLNESTAICVEDTYVLRLTRWSYCCWEWKEARCPLPLSGALHQASAAEKDLAPVKRR